MLIQFPFRERPETTWTAISELVDESMRGEKTRISSLRLLTHCFVLRPCVFSRQVRSLDAELKQDMRDIVMQTESSTEDMMLQSVFRMLKRYLAMPVPSSAESVDAVDESAWALEEFLDLDHPRFTPRMLNFLCQPSVCESFIHFITRCKVPNPPVGKTELHGALRQSYKVMRLVTANDANVTALLKVQGSRIARQLFQEGFDPAHANLYHVAALLVHMLTVNPVAVCHAFLTLQPSPIDAMIRVIHEPAVAQLVVMLAGQPSLFETFRDDCLLPKMVDLVMRDNNDKIASLVAHLLEMWSIMPPAKILFELHGEEGGIFSRIAAGSLTARSTIVLLNALCRMVALSRCAIAIALQERASVGDSTEDLSDSLASLKLDQESGAGGEPSDDADDVLRQVSRSLHRLIPLASAAVDDDSLWGSKSFSPERLALLALLVTMVVQCTESNDKVALKASLWPRLWKWTSDPFTSPLVLVQLHRLWRAAIMNPVLREVAFNGIEHDVVATVVSMCTSKKAASSTVKTVMLDLYDIIQSVYLDSARGDGTGSESSLLSAFLHASDEGDEGPSSSDNADFPSKEVSSVR